MWASKFTLPLLLDQLALQFPHEFGFFEHIPAHRLLHIPPSPVIKRMMWGSLSTDMLQTYGHLVDKDIDAAIAQLYRVVTPETETSDSLEPRQCPRCFSVWGPTLQHCGVCGAPLTREGMADLDDALDELRDLIKQDQVQAIEAIQTLQEMEPSRSPAA